MMLAAADYAEDTTKPPPPELELALSCHRWNNLPKAGGLLDQPAGLIRRMMAAENIYNAFMAKNKADDYARFGEENPGAVRIIEEIINLRKARNDKAIPGSATGGEYGG